MGEKLCQECEQWNRIKKTAYGRCQEISDLKLERKRVGAAVFHENDDCVLQREKKERVA